MIPTAHLSPKPKRHPYRFSRLCTDVHRVSLDFTMGRPFSPKNLPLPMGGSGLPSNTWFPRPTQVLNPNGTAARSVQPFLQGSLVWHRPTDRQIQRQTDRPTDHATRSVTIGRIYVGSTAMRPNNSPFNGPLYRMTEMSWYQKKTITRSHRICRYYTIFLINFLHFLSP